MGPLDILSTITKTETGRDFTVTILAEDRGDINLAPVPPEGATWKLETPTGLPTDSNGDIAGRGFDVPLRAHVTFDDALRDLKEKGSVGVKMWDAAAGVHITQQRTMDVLFIPGGIGSRLHRVDRKTGEKTLNVRSAIDFARTVCTEGFVQSAVMTVCTGSDLLAHTGLLDGRRCTTNANAFDMVAGRHAGPKWLKDRRWVRSLPEEVEGHAKGCEREIWTSAGISAGMDLMLWFVAEVWGREFARGTGRKLEYEWRERIGEGEVDPYYTTQG